MSAETPGSSHNRLEAMLDLAARRVETIPDSHRTISKHKAAPPPGTPATTWPTWWTRSDEWREALRGVLHGLGIHAEDHGHSEYVVLDTLLDALVAPVAAREAAAERRGAERAWREAVEQLDRNGPVHLGLLARARAATAAGGS